MVFVSLCYQLCCSLSLFEKISARCQTGSVTYEQVPPSSTPTMASETKTRIHGKPQIMDTTANYSYLFSKLATVEHTLFFWEDSFISGHETQQIRPPCATAFVKARWPSCPQSVAGRVSRRHSSPALEVGSCGHVKSRFILINMIIQPLTELYDKIVVKVMIIQITRMF